ncbi:MAG: alpha/beta hydrolase [Cellvibrionaceae bacterium]|nr:alpha/beta hydrolase [Cellvibrionaceae bacterium]
MKSSSRFFPARLMSAEVFGQYAEDVYLLKPNNSPDKSVELAVTHLTRVGAAVGKVPLVLVHGLHQNKCMWASEASSVGERLVEAGVDVWMFECRGHGHSPVNAGYEQNTMADYARYDIPAVNMFVAEQTACAVNWLGDGAGGGALLFALVMGALEEQSLGKVVGVGVPFYNARWSRVPGVSSLLMARRLRSVEASGPEREPMSLMSALVKENHWLASRGAFAGVDLWAELEVLSRGWKWLAPESSVSQFNTDFSRLSAEVRADCLVELPSEGVQSDANGSSLWNADKSLVDGLVLRLQRLLGVEGEFNNVSPVGASSPAV